MRRRRGRKAPIDQEWTKAPVVQEIAETLIPDHFPHLGRPGIHVKYLFSAKPLKVGGRKAAGKAQKVGGQSAFFILREMLGRENDLPKALFAVVIDQQVWPTLTDTQKEALVYHELCHLGVDETEDQEGNVKVRMKTIPHEVETFRKEIDRYGLWHPMLEKLGQTVLPHVKQLELDLAGKNGKGHTAGAAVPTGPEATLPAEDAA